MKPLKNPTLLQSRAVAAHKDPRLQPPEGLPDAQFAIWHRVTKALPSDWFSPEQVELLLAFCNHCARLAQLETALQKLDPVQDLETFSTLAKLASGESAKLLAHARSLRLTKQARTQAIIAGSHAEAAQFANGLHEGFDALDELLLA